MLKTLFQQLVMPQLPVLQQEEEDVLRVWLPLVLLAL
jgi:hypothetical protein